MIRRLSLPLLLLVLIVTPIMSGWIAIAHGMAQPMAEESRPGEHPVHAQPERAAHTNNECAVQMDSVCLQLCGMSAMPTAIALAIPLSGHRHYDVTSNFPDSLYQAPPFQPPKA